MTIRWSDTSKPDPLPMLPGRDDLLDVFVSPQADAVVKAHLASASVELGGLLVGVAYARIANANTPDVDASNRTPCITHLCILKAIPADHSEGTSVSLRMGTSVWRDAQLALGPGERIIGWYHSHPGLTAFFSDTDRQTQRAFFSHEWSVGWVIDPWLGDEAFFVGPECRPLSRGPDARGSAIASPASESPDTETPAPAAPAPAPAPALPASGSRSD